MDNVINLFTGRGQLRKTIMDSFANAPERYNAFRTFVITACPPFDDLTIKIGLSPSDLFDRIKEVMQDSIYSWTEDQVKEKLTELTFEYELIATLNDALTVSRKNLYLIQQDLKNCFDNMKVPGRIVESYGLPWIAALKVLFSISKGDFSKRSIEEKSGDLDILKRYAKEAWQHVNSSKLLLEEYIKHKGIECTVQETGAIYDSLKSHPYDSPEVVFTSAFDQQIAKIAFIRNKQELLNIWRLNSGTPHLTEWCKKYTTPIQWVVDRKHQSHFRVLKNAQDNQPLDNTSLTNAIDFFRNHAMNYLNDATHIQNCFFAQIGEDYRDMFLQHRNVLLAKIMLTFGADVYGWEYRANEISTVVKQFVKDKMKEQHLQAAQDKVRKMNEATLRSKVSMLLEEHPELCSNFISEEG